MRVISDHYSLINRTCTTSFVSNGASMRNRLVASLVFAALAVVGQSASAARLKPYRERRMANLISPACGPDLRSRTRSDRTTRSRLRSSYMTSSRCLL